MDDTKKRKLPGEPSDWPEYGDFVNDLHADWNGSGRATVLVAGAMLDTLLRRLLMAFMVDAPAASKLLGSETGGGNAPLGTFSARITAAHALGLISDREARCADQVRDIRNVFAHRLGARLTDPSIRDRIQHLAEQFDLPTMHDPEVDAREKLSNAVLVMGHMFIFRLEEVRSRRCIPLIPAIDL